MTTRFGVSALALPLFAVVLVVNGAIPWILSPTFGQALWALGFAKSFSNAPLVSIFASHIGAPTPAAIAFGLSAVFPLSLLLKLGMHSANAYAFIFAMWLAVAFWGSFRLARIMGASDINALLCSTLWLTTPIVWVHQGYSMLALGMALLPFYVYGAWRVIWEDRIGPADCGFFLLSCVVAVFMDGYTYVMYVAACAGLLVVATLTLIGQQANRVVFRLPILILGFLISYLLYSLYIGKLQFAAAPLDFFRAYGANIEFLLIPTRGVSFVADVLGLSETRNTTSYFGDSSVFTTTISAGLMLAAVVGLIVRTGNWRWKTAFFLIAIAGFYLSLGPSFKFYVMKPAGAESTMAEEFAPMATGTAFLSENLPGFNTMRASYRWAGLGAFAAWAVFAASFSGRSRFGGWSSGILVFLIVLNIPPLEPIVRYKEARDDLLDVNQVVKDTRPSFHTGELVAFVPWGNDFFLTYLAPHLKITTFNIGGDKNVDIASQSWPTPFLRFLPAQPDHSIDPDFAEKVEAILESKAANAVALSYIDNLEPTLHWPVLPVFKEAMLRVADELDDNPRLDVESSAHYTIVRLRSGTSGLGDTYLYKEPLVTPNDEPLRITNQPYLAKFFRGRGWSTLEDFGIWSTSKNSTLVIKPASEITDNPLKLTLAFTPYAPRPTDEKNVKIFANGHPLITKKYMGPATTITEQITIAPDMLNADGSLTLKFEAEPLLSPADWGEGDARNLGVKLHSISLN